MCEINLHGVNQNVWAPAAAGDAPADARIHACRPVVMQETYIKKQQQHTQLVFLNSIKKKRLTR